MTSAAPVTTATKRPVINPWIVAAAVVVPTFMEVLDTTIANVALRYIAGGLSASVNDSEWGDHQLPGGQRHDLADLGMAVEPPGPAQLLRDVDRHLHHCLRSVRDGHQSRTVDPVPGDPGTRRRRAATLQPGDPDRCLPSPETGRGHDGVCHRGPDRAGHRPDAGGYLTVFYNWRWIFYINIPVGALGCLACYLVVDDPPYLKETRAALLRRPFRFDYIGLSLLILSVTCWEILLSKGQEWDWYADPTWRAQTMAITFFGSLLLLIVHSLRSSDPVVNLRPLADRNFAACSMIVFCVYGVLYAASTTLPGLLQTLFGYDAYVSGLVLSPSGIGSVLMLLVAGFLLGRGTDARWLILVGLLLMAAGNRWMAVMNLEVSPAFVIWPRIVTFMGISLIFAPLTVAAFQGVPQHLRGAAVGLFALLRNEGGSVGTSVAKTLEQRRAQFHSARVGEFLDPLNPRVQEFLERGQSFFMVETGDPAASRLMAVEALEGLRNQQADSLAYFDDFWFFSVLTYPRCGSG